MKGYRTYISAIGAILVAIGAIIASVQTHDYSGAFTAASAGLIALAQVFQRASTTPPTDSDPLPLGRGGA